MPEYKKLDKEQAALLLVDHQSGSNFTRPGFFTRRL